MRVVVILLIGVFVSCHKNDHLINIKAVNVVTGEPYAGLKFSVVAQSPGVFESHYKNVYEGFLDANGEASFEQKMKENKSYELGIELPDGTCYFNDLYFSLKHDLEIQDVNVEMAPCAHIKFRYQNISCQNAADSIYVERYTNLGDYPGFIYPAIYLGCNNYTMADYVDVPMGWWYFEWSVTKNSITSYYSDTVYLDEDEYKYYEFNY